MASSGSGARASAGPGARAPAAAVAQPRSPAPAASPSPVSSPREGSPPAGSHGLGGQMKMHPLCYKLPSPRKTGDTSLDQDQSANYAMSQQILDSLIADPKSAPALFNELSKRKAAQVAIVGGQADQFIGLSENASIKSVCKADEGLLINWVAKRSDMSPAELVGACKKDDETLTRFVVFETGTPLSWKVGEQLHCKPVCIRVLDKLGDQLGGRTNNFKANNGIKGDGSVDWKFGVYRPELPVGQQDPLVLRHWNGDSVSMPNSGITQAHKLRDNFSDFGASFINPNIPGSGVKVHLFFKKDKTGPYKVMQPSSKEFKEMIEKEVAAWEQSQTLVNEDSRRQIDQALSEQSAEVAAERGKKARAAAAESLEKRKARRTVDMS